jgi:ABC-type glycerol-3-phosphate transport system substrate-binding protein
MTIYIFYFMADSTILVNDFWIIPSQLSTSYHLFPYKPSKYEGIGNKVWLRKISKKEIIMVKKISRRKFLVLASLTGSAAILSACAQPTQAPAQVTQPPQPAVDQPTNMSAATPVPAPTSTTAKPVSPTTLNIIHNWSPEDSHGPYMKDVFRRFMEANPDVTIKEDIVTDVDIAQKVNTAFLAGQEPDLIFDNDFPQTVLWPQQGVTVTLDQYLIDWGLQDAFLPAALDTFTTNYGGKLAAFPLEGYYWLFFYNPRVFKAANVNIPTNVDELIAVVPKIKATGSEVLSLAMYTDDSGFWGHQVWKKAGMTNQEYWDWEAGKQMMADIPNARIAVEKEVQFRDAGWVSKECCWISYARSLATIYFR